MTKATTKPPVKTRKGLSDARAIAMLNSAFAVSSAWARPASPEFTDETFFDLQRGWDHPVDISSSTHEPAPTL